MQANVIINRTYKFIFFFVLHFICIFTLIFVCVTLCRYIHMYIFISNGFLVSGICFLFLLLFVIFLFFNYYLFIWFFISLSVVGVTSSFFSSPSSLYSKCNSKIVFVFFVLLNFDVN